MEIQTNLLEYLAKAKVAPDIPRSVGGTGDQIGKGYDFLSEYQRLRLIEDDIKKIQETQKQQQLEEASNNLKIIEAAAYLVNSDLNVKKFTVLMDQLEIFSIKRPWNKDEAILRYEDFEEDDMVIDPKNYPPKVRHNKKELDKKVEMIRMGGLNVTEPMKISKSFEGIIAMKHLTEDLIIIGQSSSEKRGPSIVNVSNHYEIVANLDPKHYMGGYIDHVVLDGKLFVATNFNFINVYDLKNFRHKDAFITNTAVTSLVAIGPGTILAAEHGKIFTLSNEKGAKEANLLSPERKVLIQNGKQFHPFTYTNYDGLTITQEYDTELTLIIFNKLVKLMNGDIAIATSGKGIKFLQIRNYTYEVIMKREEEYLDNIIADIYEYGRNKLIASKFGQKNVFLIDRNTKTVKTLMTFKYNIDKLHFITCMNANVPFVVMRDHKQAILLDLITFKQYPILKQTSSHEWAATTRLIYRPLIDRFEINDVKQKDKNNPSDLELKTYWF